MIFLWSHSTRHLDSSSQSPSSKRDLLHVPLLAVVLLLSPQHINYTNVALRHRERRRHEDYWLTVTRKNKKKKKATRTALVRASKPDIFHFSFDLYWKPINMTKNLFHDRSRQKENFFYLIKHQTSLHMSRYAKKKKRSWGDATCKSCKSLCSDENEIH